MSTGALFNAEQEYTVIFFLGIALVIVPCSINSYNVLKLLLSSLIKGDHIKQSLHYFFAAYVSTHSIIKTHTLEVSTIMYL